MAHDAGLSGLGRVAPASAGGAAPQVSPSRGAASFAQSLAQATAGQRLKFSAHATSRLASRHITLSADQMARVEQAADLAARQGSRDALLMMDDLGLIVNIRNRTVLTALDLGSSSDGIVTNIDSTVVVRK